MQKSSFLDDASHDEDVRRGDVIHVRQYLLGEQGPDDQDLQQVRSRVIALRDEIASTQLVTSAYCDDSGNWWIRCGSGRADAPVREDPTWLRPAPPRHALFEFRALEGISPAQTLDMWARRMSTILARGWQLDTVGIHAVRCSRSFSGVYSIQDYHEARQGRRLETSADLAPPRPSPGDTWQLCRYTAPHADGGYSYFFYDGPEHIMKDERAMRWCRGRTLITTGSGARLVDGYDDVTCDHPVVGRELFYW